MVTGFVARRVLDPHLVDDLTTEVFLAATGMVRSLHGRSVGTVAHAGECPHTDPLGSVRVATAKSP
nr:hypothetical protein [Actinoallomurus iriomotensis]